MSQSDAFASGKDHTTENFPVGSFLIAPRHRPVVMAFYRVARAADDIADHPTAPAADKLAALQRIEDGLTGRNGLDANAVALRRVLADKGLSDQHALDLLTAFRRDVTQSRYAERLMVDWELERAKFWQIVPKEMVERLEHPVTRDAEARQRA